MDMDASSVVRRLRSADLVEINMSLLVVGGDLQGTFKMVRGLPQVAAMGANHSQIGLRFRELRIGSQRLLELHGGRLAFALLQKYEPQVAVGSPVCGIDAKGLSILRGRIVQPAEAQEHRSQVIACPDAVRLEAHGFLVMV